MMRDTCLQFAWQSFLAESLADAARGLASNPSSPDRVRTPGHVPACVGT
jgi:hypothetical protein